jgi:hypothetical protein
MICFSSAFVPLFQVLGHGLENCSSAIFCNLSFVALFTDHALTESDQRVISPNPAIVLPAFPEQLGCMGNDSTA